MKSILVHIDASPRSAQRLALACDLARRHAAELTVAYGVMPSVVVSPWVVDATGATASLQFELDREQRERARKTFDSLSSDLPMHWELAGGDALLWQLRGRALVHDLLVLGQHDPDDDQAGAVPDDLVPMLIADSGKPALVVPAVGAFRDLPATVLLAWKPTREAARAATAALPWLQRATQVHIAWQPGPDADDTNPPLAPLLHWLALHGVSGRVEPHRLAAGDVGNALLSLAADAGAELLVMGFYGHGRAREWILGGATRTVLKTMTLPVLMAH